MDIYRGRLFSRIQDLVHSYVLNKILAKRAKLLAKGKALPENCTYTIWQSLRIPCFHKIFERTRAPRYLLLKDVHPY
jgi:hypothetical protein